MYLGGEDRSSKPAWSHRSTTLRWTLSTRRGGKTRADNHCPRSITCAPRCQTRLMHCPHGWLQVTRVSPQCLWPNVGHKTFKAQKSVLTSKAFHRNSGCTDQLKLLLLPEINVLHLAFLHASAWRVHCSVSRAAFFREMLDFSHLWFFLLRQAAISRSRVY